jgi:very-short-patch-repair endonuclease
MSTPGLSPSKLDQIRTNHERQAMGHILNAGRTRAVRRARKLRRDDTNAEAQLWNALRARRLGGWKWKRQVPFGPFILDFFCPDAALVVELDGGQHTDQAAYDARRTAYLERHGLRVIRFWNSAVLTNRTGVCDSILDACGGEHPEFEAPQPPPLPREARGRG